MQRYVIEAHARQQGAIGKFENVKIEAVLKTADSESAISALHDAGYEVYNIIRIEKVPVRVTFSREILVDECPDTSYFEDDDSRLDEYERGKFDFVGVVAKAELLIPYGADFIREAITSPGVWNIESDADESDFDEIYQGELSILKDMLNALSNWQEAE